MNRYSFRQVAFILSAVLLAAVYEFFPGQARAETVASMFAPAVKEQVAEKKPEPVVEAPKAPPTGEASLTGGGLPLLEEAPPAPASVVTVDDRGNVLLVIGGEEEGPAPPTIVTDDLDAPVSAPSAAANSSPIQVDERGRKTLVIKGDAETSSSSSSITVDEHGRKTLVIRGDEENPVALSADGPPVSETGSSPWHSSHSTPAEGDEPAVERPYWIVDQAENPQPYFLETRVEDTAPYWLKKEEAPEKPYWVLPDQDDEGPYWLPKKPKKDKTPPASAKTAAPAGFAPAIHDAAGGANTREISVFMYKDDKGVVHVSNAPTDPRYRLFNITVVDIKVQRGLAGGRARFTQESLRPYIMKAARTHNLDPALIAAIIKSESAFDANAVSWAGAQGLMQLMPRTAREVGCHDPFDPEANIMGGSRYIRWMLDRFNGNLDLAIAAYNCGPTRVAREWKIPNIPETQNYVVIVKRNYARYQGQF